MEKTEVFVELHVPDFQKAIDFYKILGFKVLWVGDRYLVMKKGGKALFFYGGDEKIFSHPYFKNFPKDTKKGYGVEIVMYEKDVEGFYSQIKGKVKVVEPLALRHWGKKDFRVEDPFGYYIRIGEVDKLLTDKKEIAKSKEYVKKNNLRV